MDRDERIATLIGRLFAAYPPFREPRLETLEAYDLALKGLPIDAIERAVEIAVQRHEVGVPSAPVFRGMVIDQIPRPEPKIRKAEPPPKEVVEELRRITGNPDLFKSIVR